MKLRALCEGLEIRNIDKLLTEGTIEQFSEIGELIAKAAKNKNCKGEQDETVLGI